VRTREYDFKSSIKRIVSELTLGQLHNTIRYIYTGSGHRLSAWYHADLAPLGHDSLGLITSRGMEFEPSSRPEHAFLLATRTPPRKLRGRCGGPDMGSPRQGPR
jgi:hypothetical protein